MPSKTMHDVETQTQTDIKCQRQHSKDPTEYTEYIQQSTNYRYCSAIRPISAVPRGTAETNTDRSPSEAAIDSIVKLECR